MTETADIPFGDGERRHDPLCPISSGPCCPWMGDCDCQCECDWIARVREDEQTRTYSSEAMEAVIGLAASKAYDAALRDAVQAVSRQRRHHEFSWGLDESEDGDWIWREYAVAAIEALGGER